MRKLLPMRLREIIIFIFCSWLWTGCGKLKDTKLEEALKLSGNNRGELEKVLKYFSRNPADSLKLKSAVFLIENMPGHWGPDSACIQSYKVRIDTIPRLSAEERYLLLGFPAQHPELCREFKKIEDIHSLKAKDLIRHIKWSCRLKDSCSWLSDTGFDIFAEYILPYRFGNEYVDFSMDTVQSSLSEDIIFALHNYNDCQISPVSIASYIQRQGPFAARSFIKDTLLRKLISTDENQTKLSLLRLKQASIPMAMDYSPIQCTANRKNFWLVPADSRLITRSLHKATGLCSGKIYRRTFSRNPIPQNTNTEFIPSFFQDPFQKDVTDLYLHTTDISLQLHPPQGIHYVYLAMFNDTTWQAVAYSEIKNGKCTFTKLGKNCLYLPVCYLQGRQQALSSPLILRSNKQLVPLNGMADSVVDLRIERLYPYINGNNYYAEQLQKSRFECADNENFVHPDTIFTIKEIPSYYLYSIHPDQQLKKRYWRLQSCSGYCTISELHFLNEAGEQLTGRYLIQDTTGLAALTDNDPLTRKVIPQGIGIDFGRPVQVATIRYMNFNDGYNVRAGHEYELFYYRDNKWIPAGIQKASGQSIQYSRVPANRLYRLKDKTQNINGRIFTWEKGRVRFW